MNGIEIAYIFTYAFNFVRTFIYYFLPGYVAVICKMVVLYGVANPGEMCYLYVVF